MMEGLRLTRGGAPDIGGTEQHGNMAGVMKVGIVGVGYTCRVHAPGWRDSPYTEIHALADLDPHALALRASDLGVKTCYASAEELIADPEIDIVDVCVPNTFHAKLTCMALRAGKHVLCEKPLAPTPGEIREMIEARDSSGKYLMTAQHMRYIGTARALKAEIERGALGPIYHARAWWLRRAGAPRAAGFVRRALSGGGPCIDIGVHVLDLALWMMDFPRPVSVMGVTTDRLSRRKGAFSDWHGPLTPGEMDVEEFAAAMVRFENGASLMLETSWLLHHPDPNGEDCRMWLYGEQAGAVWPDNSIHSSNLATRQHYDTRLRKAAEAPPHALECMDFADAIANGRPSPVPAEQSLDTMAILDGLYRSAGAGREARLD